VAEFDSVGSHPPSVDDASASELPEESNSATHETSERDRLIPKGRVTKKYEKYHYSDAKRPRILE